MSRSQVPFPVEVSSRFYCYNLPNPFLAPIYFGQGIWPASTKKMHGLRFFRHSYCWDWHCLGFMRFLRRRSLFFFWCAYVIITFHSTCPLADCWRIMWQLANLHCASMGLHETTLCCPGHEHLHVEQSIHRTTSYANWRVGDYTHPTCTKEASMRWLRKWCNGWAFSHLLNRETLLRVTVSIRRQ